ncbi:MAG: dioxygenase [Acidobacteriota bacterium]
MRAIDHNTITDAAIEQMASTPNQRLREVMNALVRHLHAFTREVDLTPEEWLEGIKFLTAVGQKCTPVRQEFILLSDTLGLSTLVNSLHDRRAVELGTKTSLLGPFYREDSPVLALGECIVESPRQQVLLYGSVTDTQGNRIPNATVEVWQTDEEGAYDLQRKDATGMDMRGKFQTGAEGNYFFRTVLPLGYMIPLDGPVGALVLAQKRHGYRPAHIHFLIGAAGFRELVTALYLSDDDHLESDTVFGVTDSLVVKLKDSDPAAPMQGMPSIQFDFRLAETKDVTMGRVGADPSQIIRAGA